MKTFLDFLEKGSAFLDRISKPMERKMAYFFCFLQIIVCFLSIGIAVGFFVYNFSRQTAFEVRLTLILFIAVILFMLGGYVHMLITRDLKHIREQNPDKKEDTAKKRKIEF